jgi:hypothetical protein
MRLITWEDEGLFRTVMSAARLGRAGTLIEHLGKRYAEEWDDAEAGLPYALAMVAALQTGALFPESAGPRQHGTTYDELTETLEDVLYVAPDHWLARYCRVFVRVLLPTSGGREARFARDEHAKARTDIAELIALQRRAPWQPYFSCAYVVAARLAAEGDYGDASAGQLIAEACDKPNGPIPFRMLGSIMCPSFIALHANPDLPERARLGALMATLFPNEPAVTAALRGQPAR